MPSPSSTWTVTESSRPGKKWAARGEFASGRVVTVHFGATGYSDFTQHKDKARRDRYIDRHRGRENWGKTGIATAGFWSRWLLWNRASLRASAADISSRFGVRVRISSAR